MKNNIKLTLGGILVAMVFCVITTPFAFAQTTTYQPQTQAERIAYIQGRIAQLMQIKQLLDRGNTLAEAVAQSTVDYVTIDTHKATDVGVTTAILRGEVNLFGKATAQAWFEYGEDEDFLDRRTNQVYIHSVYDRPVRTKIDNLKEDERYYFRIVTVDTSKIVSYGPIYSFTTDEVDED